MRREKIQDILHIVDSSPTWLSYRRACRQLRSIIDQESETFSKPIKIAVLSSFTTEPLIDFLTVESARNGIVLDIFNSGYNQFSREIYDSQSTLYEFNPELTFLFVEPQQLVHSKDEQTQQQFIEAIQKLTDVFTKHSSGLLICGTFVNAPLWPFHILADDLNLVIERANSDLRKYSTRQSQLQILELDSLVAYYGYAQAFSAEMQSMARMPFSEGFLKQLSIKMVSHILAEKGFSKKCLVLDCDNTLWGGIIGEDGIDGIKLGLDWPGREFVEFQKAILELYEQGVILAINSKNNEADVMAVLRDHPHMLLRENHFAAIAANWNPKPENMQQIAKEINIGMDSFVFVDDNPAERTMMIQMLPEVAVLELPPNPALYAKALRETNYFAKASLTEEDKNRGQIYAAQRQRQTLKKTTTSLEDYLKSLEMVCSIRLARKSDIKRVAQLTQRTNQFNVTTRRYSEMDIQQMLESPNWNVYVLGLKDTFGDNGTVGLALVEKRSDCRHIDTFLMSCRVIGRQAEEALVDRICRDAHDAGAVKLTAEYLKTPKNSLVADFWQKMNFTGVPSAEMTVHYQYDLSQYQPKTFEYLTIES